VSASIDTQQELGRASQLEGHEPRARRGGFRRWTAGGWLRVAWVVPLAFLATTAAVIACRVAMGLDTRGWGAFKPDSHFFHFNLADLQPLIVAWTTLVPLAFLAAIGGFDYWAYWVSGRPQRPEDHSGHGARSWRDYFRVNTDHKVIGIQYVCTTMFFFVAAGLMAMFLRAELARPGMQFVDNNGYNGLFSVHATLMIFLFIIPVFAGLGNFVIPLMIGAPDMAFPRLNALSYWLLPIAGLIMLSSFLVPDGHAFAAGWTNYVPLSVQQPIGNLMFQMGVQWAGASSIMTALNFLVTIITMRAPGMTFWRLPLLVWANFATSTLVVIATPFVAGSQFFIMFDRVLHTNFFNPAAGGDVVGYQHIFWFYSHPAVYIMMLPGFGIASEVISVFARKPIFGYRLMALSLLAILILGFSVWAHHMFVSGMAPWLRVPMMVTTLLIAVPTGIKVFSWLATLWEGRIHFKTPMLFASGFVSMFVIGGLSGIFLGAVPIDIHASDTYFVVAHIHYVLFGGSLFTIFAGIYYWFPKMTGRMYDERLGKIHFWLTFITFNLTFFPMHWLGLRGMPRRVSDYDPAFGTLNMIISISSFVLGASTILFLYNMIVSWRRGEQAPSNPWRALTLEWQVSSPPPIFNFDEIPQVVGSPYAYGVRGARHAVLAEKKTEAAAAPEPVEALH
jgi:cytochrome c oxidase subunit 1